MATNRPVDLVTGASSGIGKETALALVAAGFDVAGTGRDTLRVTPLGGVTFLDLDVGQRKVGHRRGSAGHRPVRADRRPGQQ
jgi:NADP-dependent 3-hydroxy acid dehydrogenase YdfG